MPNDYIEVSVNGKVSREKPEEFAGRLSHFIGEYPEPEEEPTSEVLQRILLEFLNTYAE